MMLKKLPLEKIEHFLKNYHLWILGIIFALLLCLNGLIYYQYVYLAIKAQPKPILEEVVIDQETLDKVLDNLDIRIETLSRVETTAYSDPFR
jgi:hypothetical protein